MKKFLFILLLIAPLFLVHAQSNHPQRTPEDIARKQTEMMVRELGIQDMDIKDRIYHMHLKFARKRAVSNTRAEALQYMQEANKELKQLLTPEQYQQFMNQQINHESHRRPHHASCKRIIPHSGPTVAHDTTTHTPPTQQMHQQ